MCEARAGDHPGIYQWLLAVFHAPSREECTAQRVVSNTPQQALTLLNSPIFIEAARVFAQRIMLHGLDADKQIDYAFRLCVVRPPTQLERRRLLDLYQQQLKSFERDSSAAEKLVTQGSAQHPLNLNAPQLAAWMMVSNVLLNLDETITKE